MPGVEQVGQFADLGHGQPDLVHQLDLGKYPGWGIHQSDLPIAEDHHPVGEFGDLFALLLDHDDGHLLSLLQLPDHAEDLGLP